MMWHKRCTRCHGDLFAGEDRFGRYIACAQCGHELTRAEEQALLAPASPPAGAHRASSAAQVEEHLATAGR